MAYHQPNVHYYVISPHVVRRLIDWAKFPKCIFRNIHVEKIKCNGYKFDKKKNCAYILNTNNDSPYV